MQPPFGARARQETQTKTIGLRPVARQRARVSTSPVRPEHPAPGRDTPAYTRPDLFHASGLQLPAPAAPPPASALRLRQPHAPLLPAAPDRRSEPEASPDSVRGYRCLLRQIAPPERSRDVPEGCGD